MAATPETPSRPEEPARPLRLIVVSGMSGSGKSVALNVLEDSGYYCVDNLPANLLDPLVAFVLQAGYDKIAVGVDVRSGPTLERLPRSIEQLRSRVADVRLLFLDAKTDTLVKRFSETRRRHPLSDSTSTLQECIQAERVLLAELGTLGHRIDTSDLPPNALRGWVKDFVGMSGGGMTLLFQSFGFKHGIPLDADLVFDVRCLPNPHYDPVLRPLTGRDTPVIEFLQGDENARRMLADIGGFVERWLPCFVRDNRSYLTVAVGCTGGRHRSVYFTEQLAQRFRSQLPALVRHRELAE